jgi:hypothetical protein
MAELGRGLNFRRNCASRYGLKSARGEKRLRSDGQQIQAFNPLEPGVADDFRAQPLAHASAAMVRRHRQRTQQPKLAVRLQCDRPNHRGAGLGHQAMFDGFCDAFSGEVALGKQRLDLGQISRHGEGIHNLTHMIDQVQKSLVDFLV